MQFKLPKVNSTNLFYDEKYIYIYIYIYTNFVIRRIIINEVSFTNL